MSSKKSQAAMEFLMTYGWAILVVLAAITAIAYFGVLSPEEKLPEKCIFPQGIGCVGFSYIEGNVEIAIINSLGHTMTDINITVEGCAGSSTEPDSLKNNEDGIYRIPCDLSGEGRVDRDVYMEYVNKESGLRHRKEGHLIMKVLEE